jgi:hypothetical protein
MGSNAFLDKTPPDKLVLYEGKLWQDHGSLLKEITDNWNRQLAIDWPIPTPKPLPDPIGPIKYDLQDWLVRSYLETIPAVMQRVQAMEQHLEKDLPEGKPFIRAQERPPVGDEVVQQLSDGIRRLNERLDALEKKLG